VGQSHHRHSKLLICKLSKYKLFINILLDKEDIVLRQYIFEALMLPVLSRYVSLPELLLIHKKKAIPVNRPWRPIAL
jgi:hypothetical protein